jgi:membrane dipeptidase
MDDLARAHALLDRILLVDGHNDLPWVIRRAAKGDLVAYDLTRAHQETDTDIPRLKAGRLDAQFWAAFVPTSAPHPGRTTLEQIDLVRRMVELHPDVFLLATKPADVARAKREGRIASFLTVESGVGLENALAPLRIWRAAGVRLLTLCHNETLDWIDSATDAPRAPGGLSPFGEAVVRECNRLGIMVDLAHVAPHAMHRVLDVTRAPVLWSHSCAAALSDHPRNVPDDVLARVRANGGVVMPTFVPEFLSRSAWAWERDVKPMGKMPPGANRDAFDADRTRTHGPQPRATLEHWLDHVEYLAGKIGVAHLGIGSDFYGGATPDGLEDVACFPRLVAGLLRRGFSEGDVRRIAGANLLRVFRKVERVGAELQRTEKPLIGRRETFDGAGQ